MTDKVEHPKKKKRDSYLERQNHEHDHHQEQEQLERTLEQTNN